MPPQTSPAFCTKIETKPPVGGAGWWYKEGVKLLGRKISLQGQEKGTDTSSGLDCCRDRRLLLTDLIHSWVPVGARNPTECIGRLPAACKKWNSYHGLFWNHWYKGLWVAIFYTSDGPLLFGLFPVFLFSEVLFFWLQFFLCPLTKVSCCVWAWYKQLPSWL